MDDIESKRQINKEGVLRSFETSYISSNSNRNESQHYLHADQVLRWTVLAI